jgi:SAM-dependent methyltransferase
VENKVTLKTRKSRSKSRTRGLAAKRSRVRRSAPSLSSRRKSARRGGAARPESAGLHAAARAAFKRSSPHPSEAREVAAVLPAEETLVVPTLNSRTVPRFPEDDYDYAYLHDFLGLPYVPHDCRAVVFGCGRGEEAVYFSERGYRVTGIDSDRNSIGLARERAWLNGRDIDFMIGDVFESANLLPAESFGLGSDRGIFRGIEGERDRRRYLDLVRRLLLPGGVFLLAATSVELGRKSRKRRRRGRDDLLVQKGGEVMGEVLRAGLDIAGRKHYPVHGDDGRADLMLYCRR